MRNVEEVDEVLLKVLLVRLIGVLVGREVSGVRVEEAVLVERTEERVVLVLVDPSALLFATRDAVLAVAREAVEGVLDTPVTEGVLVARVVEVVEVVVVVPEVPLVAGTLEGRGGVAVVLTPAAASEDTLGFRVVVVEVPSVINKEYNKGKKK